MAHRGRVLVAAQRPSKQTDLATERLKSLLSKTGLTNRWSQPLVAVKSTFDFMKDFLVFATLAAASGGSALSR
jgi:hypothetical protein